VGCNTGDMFGAHWNRGRWEGDTGRCAGPGPYIEFGARYGLVSTCHCGVKVHTGMTGAGRLEVHLSTKVVCEGRHTVAVRVLTIVVIVIFAEVAKLQRTVQPRLLLIMGLRPDQARQGDRPRGGLFGALEEIACIVSACHVCKGRLIRFLSSDTSIVQWLAVRRRILERGRTECWDVVVVERAVLACEITIMPLDDSDMRVGRGRESEPEGPASGRISSAAS
jgi:hypothetical protein